MAVINYPLLLSSRTRACPPALQAARPTRLRRPSTLVRASSHAAPSAFLTRTARRPGRLHLSPALLTIVQLRSKACPVLGSQRIRHVFQGKLTSTPLEETVKPISRGQQSDGAAGVALHLAHDEPLVLGSCSRLPRRACSRVRWRVQSGKACLQVLPPTETAACPSYRKGWGHGHGAAPQASLDSRPRPSSSAFSYVAPQLLSFSFRPRRRSLLFPPHCRSSPVNRRRRTLCAAFVEQPSGGCCFPLAQYQVQHPGDLSFAQLTSKTVWEDEVADCAPRGRFRLEICGWQGTSIPPPEHHNGRSSSLNSGCASSNLCRLAMSGRGNRHSSGTRLDDHCHRIRSASQHRHRDGFAASRATRNRSERRSFDGHRHCHSKWWRNSSTSRLCGTRSY